MKIKTRITGWAGNFTYHGVQMICLVKARTKHEAVSYFELAFGFHVEGKHIKKSRMVRYPGPKAVQEMPEFKLNKTKAATHD